MVIVLLRIYANSRLYILPPIGHHSTSEQTQLRFQSITDEDKKGRKQGTQNQAWLMPLTWKSSQLTSDYSSLSLLKEWCFLTGNFMNPQSWAHKYDKMKLHLNVLLKKKLRCSTGLRKVKKVHLFPDRPVHTETTSNQVSEHYSTAVW